MTTNVPEPGSPRPTQNFTQNTAAGAEAALAPPKAQAPSDGIDEARARTLGGRFLAAGGALLAGSLALVGMAGTGGVVAGLGLMSMMAGMGATTIGVTLRFPKMLGSYIPDRR